jgi:YD repeat-containing protein
VTQTNSQLGKGLSYAYDSLGNLTKITNSEDRTTSYTYDGRNLTTSLTDPDDNITRF